MRGRSSTQIHYGRATYTRSRDRTPLYKKIVLVIIALTVIIVIATIVAIPFLEPERRVKADITALATDYYENYLYPDDLASSPNVSKYETYGFAPITLRQLLLHDHGKNSSHTSFLSQYCDPTATIIKYYADPPYGRTDYHIDYTYSCEF